MSSLKLGAPIVKTNAEIGVLREGALVWQKIREEITPHVQIGVSGTQIEAEVQKLFDKYQVKPAFYNYKSFPGIICISVNECMVHGLANDTPLVSGDKITLDIGFLYQGMYIDSAFTLIVDADNHPEYSAFIESAKKAMWAGIKAVKPNGMSGAIAHAIENYHRDHMDPKFSILDGYTGHGIGKGLHEQPPIFNKSLKDDEGVILCPNTVICIEPMFLEQTCGNFKIGPNGFDVLTLNEKAMSVHWEHMVYIGRKNIEIFTASPEEIAKYYEQ